MRLSLSLLAILIFILSLLISLIRIHQAIDPNESNIEDAMSKRDKEKHKLIEKKRILFVIAHPDDEAMFFAPTILSLHPTANISLLCLSNGDYEGIGNLREKELVESCKVLGIESGDVRIINDDHLKDGPKHWNTNEVARYVEGMVTEYSIDEIVTFDEYGISSHPNHISVYRGVLSLLSNPKFQSLHVYKLITTNILRKYSGPLEVVYQSLVSTFSNNRSQQHHHHHQQQPEQFSIYISPRVFRGWKAMAKHKTQLLWFRYLFVLFSRYSYINTLELVIKS